MITIKYDHANVQANCECNVSNLLYNLCACPWYSRRATIRRTQQTSATATTTHLTPSALRDQLVLEPEITWAIDWKTLVAQRRTPCVAAPLNMDPIRITSSTVRIACDGEYPNIQKRVRIVTVNVSRAQSMASVLVWSLFWVGTTYGQISLTCVAVGTVSISQRQLQLLWRFLETGLADCVPCHLNI
jgi:hypothetical protein